MLGIISKDIITSLPRVFKHSLAPVMSAMSIEEKIAAGLYPQEEERVFNIEKGVIKYKIEIHRTKTWGKCRIWSHPKSCDCKRCNALEERTNFTAMITKTVKPELGGYSTRTYYPSFKNFSCLITSMRIESLCDVLGMEVDELCNFTRDSFSIRHKCCGERKTVRPTKIGGRGAGDISVTGCYDVDQLISSYLGNVQWIDNVACACDKYPENQRDDVESIRWHNGKTRVHNDTSHDCRCTKVHASEIATFS